MASPILAGLTILMLGDSHFATQGYLVTTLQDALIQQGGQGHHGGSLRRAQQHLGRKAGVAPCGTAERVQTGPIKKDLSSHAHVPTLEQLIAQVHPNLIIVGAGDTMAGYSQPTFPAQWIGEQVSALTRRIQASGIPCLWVGPGWGTEGGPYFKTYARVRMMNDYLQTHVAPLPLRRQHQVCAARRVEHLRRPALHPDRLIRNGAWRSTRKS